MKRILLFSALSVMSLQALKAQTATCGRGTAFAATETYTFDMSTQGFSGDFAWASSGSGQLESSELGAGAIKTLVTPTFFVPNTAPTLSWSFNLAGTMNVNSYTVDAKHISNGSVIETPLCSGGSLTTVGDNLIFSATMPQELRGKNIVLVIRFTSTTNVNGPGTKIYTIDNFRTSIGQSQIALPVRFGNFTAKASSGNVVLNWNVGEEVNVKGYEVERSADGRTYQSIGSVQAEGRSSYTFTDTRALSTAYYRIKSVDHDGKMGFSAVVSVKEGNTSVELKAFPAPFHNTLTIQHDAISTGTVISITAADGRMMKSIAPVKGEQQTKVDLSALQAGVYFIQLHQANGQVQSTKVIKQ